MSDDKKTEKKIEHKVGLHLYALSGSLVEGYVVVGAPRVQGKRWVTIASRWGGPVAAYPEEEFERLYWVPKPPEEPAGE